MCVNEGVDDWWHLNKNDKSVGQIHLSSHWMPHEEKSEKAVAAKKETADKPFVPPPQAMHPQNQMMQQQPQMQMQQPMMQQ